MIAVEKLEKRFRKPNGDPVMAVDGVSFSAKAGETLGLLGPNGAGKTTALRILCTLLQPTGGRASVNGFDVVSQPNDVRRQIGFVSANTGIYDRMTAREMVVYYGRMHGLEGAELESRIKDLFEQKVSIARAMIHDPPVLIFDEPTNGLDVLIQRVVLEQVRLLRDRGKCILYSTHIFREVEKVCDRVAIIHHGKVLEAGTLAELRDRRGEHDLEEIFFSLVKA